MGEKILYLCTDCGNSFSIDFGIGMLFSPENLLDKNYKYNLLEVCKNENMYNFLELKEFFEKNDDLTIENYGYIPYICGNCKEIKSKFNFTLISQREQKEFKPIYICEKCGKNLISFSNEEIKNLSCPKCQSKNLKTENFINWD